ncbi:RidA family protein [Agrobacterium tumefaciens]|uniref:RidA family protein n=1 Tax=Agrobacterium tumefaciens TaxID=358 RepID=UPI0015731CC0|nr:RidA family protein [Agrobacterium tumefaciens]NSY99646.1 RidA family protein [Agrobacterium tumefaciens]NSZ36399.1 RidA family protein [Agrobacterium tumefaciens]NTB21915.1 RidA family protein [Agrobacterium tumefaciens]NTB31739.1 RidA family protein [Agrobacterium tumefaciens]NTB32220.1 RidA family protein [Agrobacterium tumefaciens]
MSQAAALPRQDDIQRYETVSRLSRIVVHNGIAYISGTLADDPSGSVEEQTQNILSKIDGWLESVGSHKTRILTATVWLKDVEDAPKMNSVWEQWMPDGYASSRSCVQSTPGRAAFSVEIACQAAVA